jgi:monoamine oxidase
MARTPLLNTLRCLFRDARLARANGLSLEALRETRAVHAERARTRGISRRAFLASAGAATAATVIPRWSLAAAEPSVVIVGAGIAGLNCALELADLGIKSTVYEASGRLGGRMFTNAGYWSSNQVTEWCGELIDTGHTTIRRLAKRFGLPLDNLLGAQPHRSDDIYRFFGGYYPKSQANQDFLAVSGRISADAEAAGFPTTFDSSTAAGRALDRMSVYDYIERRVPGGHRSPLGALLDVAYVIEYGADSTDQSALNLIFLLGFQPDGKSLSVFGESDEKFHIRGGNQQLPEAMARHLGPDVVKTGQRLARIKETANGRYKVTFERAGGASDVTADFVVLALPFAVLNELDISGAGFDALKHQAIAEQGRAHNGKLHLQFTRRDWLGTGPWPGVSNGSSYSDTGYQVGWEATRAQTGNSGILVFYSGGSTTDAAVTNQAFANAGNGGVRTDAAIAQSQIATVYPGLSWNGKATQSLPHKSPLFRASYSFYRVGQYTTFGGYEQVRQGGVLFCGEHTSIDFQGFMEGAAAEGQRAGRQLASMLDRRAVDRAAPARELVRLV